MDAPSQNDLTVETAPRLQVFVPPAHLAAMINPVVLAERQGVVEARLGDVARTRVLRRRCAEIVAEYLLKEDAAHDAA